MRSLNHSGNLNLSYKVSSWVRLSRGVYLLLLISLTTFSLTLYSIHVNLYAEQTHINIVHAFVLYIIFMALAIDTSVASFYNSINVGIELYENLELIEGESISIRFSLKPKSIAKLIVLKNIILSADIGLQVSGWKFDRETQCIEVYISGYPGKHYIDGLTLNLETPLSILRIDLQIVFREPVEVRVIPAKPKHKFNVEAVVPYLPLIEGRSSRRKGAGSEVMSVREFTPHDEYKRIHWKATAKTGKLMVKEYEHRMYRNALVITSIHYWFYLGNPPPLIFLFRMIIDIVETLTSMGIKVALGVITEEDVKIVDFIDKSRLHEAYKTLSEVKWPKDLSVIYIRYTSSNRILRWFVNTIVKNICRDPSIVILAIDPLDDLDISAITHTVSFLERHKHSVKILLTTPSTLRFIYSSRIRFEDISGVIGEISRVRRILAKFKPKNVYLPTVYLKT